MRPTRAAFQRARRLPRLVNATLAECICMRMRLSIFPLQSAYKVDKSITSKEGTAQEKDAVPGVDDSEKPVPGSSTQSSSSSSGSSEPMEAADEGRKAEDIPAKEIEDSLHQAEVRTPPVDPLEKSSSII